MELDEVGLHVFQEVLSIVDHNALKSGHKKIDC